VYVLYVYNTRAFVRRYQQPKPGLPYIGCLQLLLVCTLSCYSVPHMEDCTLLCMHTAAQLKPGQERLRRFDMDVDLGLRVVGVPTSSLRVSVQYPAV